MAVSMRGAKSSRGMMMVADQSSYKLLAEVTEGQSPDAQICFAWMRRPCYGADLHAAALLGDVRQVRRLLKEDPKRLHSRFRYELRRENAPSQECTGEAIHLAASKGHVEVTRLLLDSQASVNAEVTRAGARHFNVLHAAVFAEGAGGNSPIVRLLLDSEADIAENSKGLTPLHLAFQLGALDALNLLRANRKHRGLPDPEDVRPGSGKRSPLEVAIEFGGLSDAKIVAGAPLTPIALHTLCLHEPRCIPQWLDRFSEATDEELEIDPDTNRAEFLATHLSGEGLVSVLRICPASADALLRSMTCTPAITGSSGYHPLPPKVWFGPRNRFEELLLYFNPPRTCLATYQRCKTWDFDTVNFEAPPWHSTFTLQGGASGSRFERHNAAIGVCHIPDLVCKEFFHALNAISTGREEQLATFSNPAIEGLVGYVFWSSASRVEFVQLLLTVWGLLLLILEEYLSNDEGYDSAHVAKSSRLMSEHHFHNDPTARPFQRRQDDLKLSKSFLMARGIVDVVHETGCLFGICRMGYFPIRVEIKFQLAADLIRAIVPLILFFRVNEDVALALRSTVIILYWTSLLKAQYFSEHVARVLLPLTDLLWGLVPSLLLTLVFFLAYCHVCIDIKGGSAPWGTIFLESFKTLFVGGLDDEETSSQLMTVLSVVGFAFFTLFFLNIFIGVITDLYQTSQDRVHLRYREVLSHLCMTYLIRSRHLRLGTVRPHVAVAAGAIAFATGITFQMANLIQHDPNPRSGGVFTVCIAVMLLAGYGSSFEEWVPAETSRSGWHLWIATKADEPEEPRSSEVLHLSEIIRELRELRRDNRAPGKMRGAPTMSLHRSRTVAMTPGQSELQRQGTFDSTGSDLLDLRVQLREFRQLNWAQGHLRASSPD